MRYLLLITIDSESFNLFADTEAQGYIGFNLIKATPGIDAVELKDMRCSTAKTLARWQFTEERQASEIPTENLIQVSPECMDRVRRIIQIKPASELSPPWTPSVVVEVATIQLLKTFEAGRHEGEEQKGGAL